MLNDFAWGCIYLGLALFLWHRADEALGQMSDEPAGPRLVAFVMLVLSCFTVALFVLIVAVAQFISAFFDALTRL